ncbi:MAG: HRDC domain-containing protein, partial [Clostridia bacterium]
EMRKQKQTDYTGWELALWENLKDLRFLLANRRHAPAYTVFSDASLHDMIKKRPATLDAFLDVSGVGLTKQQKFGKAFLAVIRDGKEPNEAMEEMDE